jgi:DNA-directed RNA polymerase subunit RPC12/RpoP
MNFTAAIRKIIPLHNKMLMRKWSDGFVLSAGAILMLAGVSRVIQAFDGSSVWDMPDPVFGLKFRYLVLSFGVAELAVAFLCLFTTKHTLSLGLAAWLVLNLVVYRIGMWTMGWHHPWVLLGGLTDTLNVSPVVADSILAAIAAVLLFGSGSVLWSQREPGVVRSRIQADSGETIKMFCALCNGHILFSTENLGQKIACPHCKATITLMKPKNLKTSCPACGKHIEFPLHGLGQKIPCPHCAAQVTLELPG